MDMPKYRCHKVVEAAKILEISTEGWCVLEGMPDKVVLTPEFRAKHAPQAGGYLVRYEDGYSSWSPAEPFENGYRKIPSEMPMDLHPSVNDVLQFFRYDHLPPHLQDVSKPFTFLAHEIAATLTGNQATRALHKLLESKDCAVRAKLGGGLR